MDPQQHASEQTADRDQLAALTNELKSKDDAERLRAAIRLGELQAGDAAALLALERAAATDPRKEVRAAALSTLRTPIYRDLSERKSGLPPAGRRQLLNAIEGWAREGLLPGPLAEVLRLRYEPPAARPEAAPPRADKPRPALTEVLLSETSIRIALFLGGFFVVAAAFIVAAVVEAARVPVLLLLTAGFLGSGLGLKRRLPAAGFILYAVFTLLLVIDAWVFSQGAEFTGDQRVTYWAVVAAGMSGVWALSTVVFRSRLFSAFALLAATNAVLLISERASLSEFETLLLFQLLNLLAFGAGRALIRWEGARFALPLFVLVQLQVAVSLLLTLVLIVGASFLGFVRPAEWGQILLIWLIAVIAYVVSDQLYRMSLFRLMAVMALLPLGAFLNNALEIEPPALYSVQWVWAAAIALAGEALLISRRKRAAAYSPFMLGGAAVIFALAGLGRASDDHLLGAVFLLGAGLLYLGFMIRQRRAWVWYGSLGFGVVAYLVALLGSDRPVDAAYVLLLASMVLLTGWVGAERWLGSGAHWQGPPAAYGILTGAAAAVALVAEGLAGNPETAAIGFVVMGAYLYVLGAVRGTPAVGFVGNSALALSLAFTLIELSSEVWILPFVGLIAVLYAVGLALPGGGSPGSWSQVFSLSARLLGALVGITAPLEGGGWAAFGAALIATMFALEAAGRRKVAFAYPSLVYYLIAYVMALAALDVTEPQAYSIGSALLGFVMHYLLVRAGSRGEAFAMGSLSQLVLLGTTYIQMLATERFSFFFVLFLQSLAVLAYGTVVRSRSLILAPIAFSVLGVISVAFSVLAGVSSAILIGCTGLIMIVLAVLALLYRDRLQTAGKRLGERLGGWLD